MLKNNWISELKDLFFKGVAAVNNFSVYILGIFSLLGIINYFNGTKLVLAARPYHGNTGSAISSFSEVSVAIIATIAAIIFKHYYKELRLNYKFSECFDSFFEERYFKVFFYLSIVTFLTANIFLSSIPLWRDIIRSVFISLLLINHTILFLSVIKFKFKYN